jgi:hypothetical protein
MRRSGPPPIATWMLEHFTFGCRNEALVGDLCEEFRFGRSDGWYWRQVLGAIAIGLYRAAGNHGTVTFFALLWSMLAPAWLLVVAGVEQRADLSSRFYRMDWPWSTVCDLGLLLLANLVFIWIGIVLYQVPDLLQTKGRGVRQIWRGVAASVPVLILVSAALIVMPKYFIDVQTSGRRSLGPVRSYAITHLNPPAVRRLSPEEEWSAQYGDPVIVPVVIPLAAITDVHGASMLVRLPFFLVILGGLWRVNPTERNEQEEIPT